MNIEVDMQGLVCVGMLALAFGAGASARDLPKQPAVATAIATFEALDKNADRRLSRSEAGFDRVLAAIFADSDIDGDGYLTPSEYARATGGAPVNL
jgi:hypothetical protein